MREFTRYSVLRVLIAGYAAIWALVRGPAAFDTFDFAPRRFDPVGPLAFLDGPVADPIVVVAVLVTPVAATLLALGRREMVSGPIAAAGFLFLTTYRNSWGHLLHTENLVALHLAVLAAAPFVARVRAVGRDRDRTWAVDAMAVLTVGTYFLAGVAKLRISGSAWIDGDVLRHQIAFDNARKEVLGDTASPFAGWILRQGWLLAPAAVMTMLVELGAPLALMRGRVALVWSGAAWAFHVAILVFMAILFPYHLLGIALAPLLPVERLGATVSAWTGRFRRVSTTSIPTG
ncbi:MAG: hypothetical protein R2707_03875 [Acidimicrobiales bacterium]